MSFMFNHSQIGSIVNTPSLRFFTAVPMTANNITANLTAQAIQENELIVIVIGGLQVVTITPPAGFTKIPLAVSRTADIWVKLAGPAETGSYTFTFSGSLGGHYASFIFRPYGIEWPLSVVINEFSNSVIAGSNNPGPITNAPYNLFHPAVGFSTGNPSVSDLGVTIDNSFIPGTSSQSGSFKVWYRIYDLWKLSEVTKVTTVTAVVNCRLTALNGKRMF